MPNERDRRNVMALSLLFFLGAGLYLMTAVVVLLVQNIDSSMRVLLSIVCFALSAGMIATGVGLRSFQKWAWIVALILACLKLPAVPVGTLVGAIILFALIRAKDLFFPPPVPPRDMAAAQRPIEL